MENLYSYFIVLCCFLFVLANQLMSKKTRKLPPSPPAFPIIGHLHHVKKELYEDLTSLSSKYGPIMSLRFGCRSYVVVSSPSTIEECFTKNDIILANRPRTMIFDTVTYNYVSYAVAPYGHLWRVLRRLAVVESLSVSSLQKSSIVRQEEMQMILRSLFRLSENGFKRIDLNYWISVYALNVITRMVAGRCAIEEKDAGAELGKKLIEESSSVFGAGGTMTLCDFFPILRLIGYKGMEKEMISLHEKRDAVLQGLIDELRTGKSGFGSCRTGMHKEKTEGFLERLLSRQELEPDFLSDDTIKSMVLMMFAAGRDTSILTIEWVLLLLINHPNAMQKLRTEIDNIVGHERLLNESDFPKLTYLRCVIDETLRLYPPIPLLLPHYASQNCEIGGYDILKGTTILANAWGVQRDPKLWDQPEKFVPERFEAKLFGEKEEFSYKFLPFGMGRRACPGANLAVRNVSLVVGTLIQCFYWEKVRDEDDDTKATFQNRIILHKAKPLEAMCFPRDETIQLLSKLQKPAV